MKRRKSGFTLIELLAVILILAVIALIATSSIVSMINRAEKGALEDSAYGIIEAGNLTATENKTSINKIIAAILKQVMDQPKEINFLKELDERLDIISKQIESVSKRQYLHFNISSQHFANHGYLSNADIKDDKCLNEILGKNKNYHE